MPLFRSLAVAVLMVCFGSGVAVANSEKRARTYTFGVVPQQAAGKLARTWGPVLAYLSAASGYRLRFKTAPDIPEFERRLARGEYDIAYMNPYHYTAFSRQPGYRALAKAAGKQIRGIVVVRKDSPVGSLDELNGATMAFPAPAAFAASVLPRAHMSNADIRITPSYVSSHDSVYRGVARGLFPAGGGVMRTFNTVAPEIRQQLRVLWKSGGYTSHAIASHPRIGDEALQAIGAAMLKMSQDSAGKLLLGNLAWSGIELADDARWDDVRQLGIDLLDQLVTELDD